MKRIAVLAPELSGRGGMETAFVNLYKALENDRDYKIKFFFVEGVQDQKFLKKIPLNSFVCRKKENFFGEILFLTRLILSNKYDIFIITSKRLIMLSTYIRKLLHINVPIFSWMHFSLSKEGIYVNLKKYGDAHFAISREIYSQIKKMGVSEDKIYYLPNYVNSTNEIIKEPSKIEYIYIGRIEFLRQKNFKELIDGLSQLKYKWTLDVYGDGQDKNLCQEYIENRYPNIINRIKWHGWTADPWKCIKNGSALILTSTMEGMPMVLIESLVRGLPVLSSNCPTGPRDIIRNGENGYLYKMGDLSDFQEKLDLLRKNKLNRASVKQSVNKFSKEQYVKKIKSALESYN